MYYVKTGTMAEPEESELQNNTLQNNTDSSQNRKVWFMIVDFFSLLKKEYSVNYNCLFPFIIQSLDFIRSALECTYIMNTFLI